MKIDVDWDHPCGFLPSNLRKYSPSLWEYSGPRAFKGKVVVVGAGVAGLSAAMLLHQQGIEVELIEARPQAGGRIQTEENWSDCPLDLGAEWIHGEHSSFFQWADALQANIIEDESEELAWLHKKLIELEPAEDRTLRQLFLALDEIDPQQVPDVNLFEWASLEGFDESMHPMLYHVANELGTSPQKLGMKAYAAATENWFAGDIDFKFSDSFYHFIHQHLIQPLDAITTLNQPITEIKYQGHKILLKTDGYLFYTADKVILTTPLSQLKKEQIKLHPALPTPKKEAIDKIGIDSGMKIYLRFKKKFWREDIIGTQISPSYLDPTYGKKSKEAIYSCLIMGEKAEAIRQMGIDMSIELLLAELDGIYNAKASENFIDYYIKDWSKEPYIEAAYSYSSIDLGESRKILAQPINNKLFFAGEACNYIGHHQTVHGAFESGYLAAMQILSSEELLI